MEEINDIYFQFNNVLVEKTYTSNNNYLIEYDESFCENANCAIYFSSNDIYYPNNEDVFYDEIVVKDKYEWYKSRIQEVYKHIFIRDIKKQWYIEGINKDINTISALCDFVKSEIEGYRSVILGSSAGGFAAVLIGQLVHADKIYSFNGQYELNTLLTKSTFEQNPVLHFRKDDVKYRQWYDSRQYINSPQTIFYFYSNKSAWDIEQKQLISDIQNINVLEFKSRNHGLPFYRFNIEYIFKLSETELVELSDKITNPIKLSIRFLGYMTTYKCLCRLYINYAVKLMVRKMLFIKMLFQ